MREIARRLASDVWIDDSLLTVTINDGRVTLHGAVGSAAEKTRAARHAWLAGVTDVDVSGVEVKWWARDDMRREQPHVVKSDKEIAQAIRAAFRYDPRVLAFNPDVVVQDGVVTLTGVVDNLTAKRAAEEDARNTVGVWRVRNYLRVRPASLVDDVASAEQIRAALTRDPFVDRHRIIVTVHNGKAHLAGTVDSQFEKAHAEYVAARVNGVYEVANNLMIAAPQSSKSDRELKQDIQSELWWSPYVNSEAISVSVRDGVATLRGTVDSWAEHRAAIENAYEGGALIVRDDLKVKHGPAE